MLKVTSDLLFFFCTKVYQNIYSDIYINIRTVNCICKLDVHVLLLYCILYIHRGMEGTNTVFFIGHCAMDAQLPTINNNLKLPCVF